MASIKVLSQSIERINQDKYFIKLDVETNVKPNASFDLTVKNETPVSMIVSPSVYQGLKPDIGTRTNSNVHEIKIYGFHGGKELGRILPGSNKMGNVTYPDIKYSLLSQIVFPNPEPNTKYILAIDSLPALGTIESKFLATRLLAQDLDLFEKNLDKFRQAIQPIGSNIQVIVYKDNISFTENLKNHESIINLSTFIEANKIVRYLGDIVFGRVFGGTQGNFSTVLALTGSDSGNNISSPSIIATFSQHIPDSDFACNHVITLRGSGITISGNTTSSVGVIVDIGSSLVNNIKITDTSTGETICVFDNIKTNTTNPEHLKLGKFVEILKYIKEAEKINFSDEKNVIKSHMKLYKDFIQFIEYCDYEELGLFEDKFAQVINSNIIHLVKWCKKRWADYRSRFQCVPIKKCDPFDNELTHGIPNNKFDPFNIELTPGLPGPNVATRQYTECVGSKVTFDDLVNC